MRPPFKRSIRLAKTTLKPWSRWTICLSFIWHDSWWTVWREPKTPESLFSLVNRIGILKFEFFFNSLIFFDRQNRFLLIRGANLSKLDICASKLNVSKIDFNFLQVYCNSKLSITLFANELNRRLNKSRSFCICKSVHPGNM